MPAPTKGYLGKALQSLHPRHWFAKPMLFVPLYRAPNGELRRAPLTDNADSKAGGFAVAQPTEFVRRHPHAVKFAMLAIRAGLQLGAAQLGVALPVAALDSLSVRVPATQPDPLPPSDAKPAGPALLSVPFRTDASA